MDRASPRRRPSALLVGWIVAAMSIACSSNVARANEPDVVRSDNGGTCREPGNQSRVLDLEARPATALSSLPRQDWTVPVMLARPSDEESDDAMPLGANRAVQYSLSDGVAAGVHYSRARMFRNASSEEARARAIKFGGLATSDNRDVLDLGIDWGIGDRSSVGIAYQLHSTRSGSAPGPDGRASSSILPGSERIDHAVTFGVRRSWGGND